MGGHLVSRSILRFVVAPLALFASLPVVAFAVACSDGAGSSSGAPGASSGTTGTVASGTTSGGAIDTPDRNVICPNDGGGPRCGEGGDGGGD
jgi:hypothetical protein